MLMILMLVFVDVGVVSLDGVGVCVSHSVVFQCLKFSDLSDLIAFSFRTMIGTDSHR